MQKVYVRVDPQDHIVDVKNEMSMLDYDGWVLIDEGTGDRYDHPQDRYFPLPLFMDYGIPRYKLTAQGWAECTEDEIIADRTILLADEKRMERSRRLFACDYTQTLDYPATDDERAAWATYRQALRDVPEQAGFPQVVVWPELPARQKATDTPMQAMDALLGVDS